VSVALVIAMMAGPPMAGAATVTREWRAKVGTAGVSGTATVQGYTTGSGAAVLKLARLKVSTLLPVVISKGTCAAVGATVVRLPSVRSSSSGAVARTLGLTAAQVTAVRKASSAGRMAFRVGSGSTARCGVFTVIPKAPVVGPTINVGALPSDVVVTPGGVFVTNWLDDTISKVDAATNLVLATIPLEISGNAGPEAIAYGDGALWVAVTGDAGSLLRVDPATGRTVATIPVGPVAVATSPGAVWVTGHQGGTVTRIDPVTNSVSATIRLEPGLWGLAYGEGAVWVANPERDTVSRIDAATNAVTATISDIDVPVGVAVGARSVWVTNWGTTGMPWTPGQPGGTVSRIDPLTNRVTGTIPVGTNPGRIAFGGGYLWVALQGAPTLVQVDPATNAVKARVTTGPVVVEDDSHNTWRKLGVAATDSSVWVVQPYPRSSDTVAPPGTLVRVHY
jgi:YVTN family beta-propeller protein